MINKTERIVNGYEIRPKANLCGANLRNANLCGADLRFADLYGADLRNANLRNANLCGADLRFADLYGADLRNANLHNANLCGADLRSADLCGTNLPTTDKVLNCPWNICHIQRNRIRIGCEYHATEEWSNFTDEQINAMDKKALAWWKQNKEIVLFIARKCEPYEK